KLVTGVQTCALPISPSTIICCKRELRPLRRSSCRAAPGEKFKTLDGQERTLTTDILLIADETKGIALAGVMGGQNSEIGPTTAEIGRASCRERGKRR